MMTTTTPVGRALRAAREALGLTREGLAARWDVHPSTLSRWERGVMEPENLGLVRDGVALLTATAGPSDAARFEEARRRLGLDRPAFAAALGVAGGDLDAILDGRLGPSRPVRVVLDLLLERRAGEPRP